MTWDNPKNPKFGQKIDHLTGVVNDYNSLQKTKQSIINKINLNNNPKLPDNIKLPQSEIQALQDNINKIDSILDGFKNHFPTIDSYIK